MADEGRTAVTWEQLFQIANTWALAGWIVLIALPRRRETMAAVRYVIVGLLAAAYVWMAFAYLFRGDQGFQNFMSLAGIAKLLSSEPALLTGWIHYLAFDLFVGAWIAERADERGWSRVAQAPVLLATFMLGPLGLAIFYVCMAGGQIGGGLVSRR